MCKIVDKEIKYTGIIPVKDLKYLSEKDKENLKDIFRRIDEGRILDARPLLSNNKYIVCNQDESYAVEVWRVILDGELSKQKTWLGLHHYL